MPELVLQAERGAGQVRGQPPGRQRLVLQERGSQQAEAFTRGESLGYWKRVHLHRKLSL